MTTRNERIEELKTLIKNKTQAIDHVKNKMDKFEIEFSDENYDNYLDEINGDVDVCGVMYSASQIVKSIDPTAYRTGKNDYVDSLDKEDQPDYQELESEVEEMEDELTDLESELEELEEKE